MGQLFQGSPLSLGPSAFDPSPEPPITHHLPGPRPSALRGGVRRDCPRKPGIYGMLDRHGELIYLGKAKNLRARLLSYFRSKSRDRKAGRIVRHTAGILWEVCPSEFAALLRELELIRRWRPRFNVQGQPLRRRQAHVCLGRSPAPYVFLAQRPPAGLLARFGPIPAGERAIEAVRRLNHLFGLRDCPQTQSLAFADEAELFPVVREPGCIRYELGTCLGPCLAACSRTAYMARVRAARALLTGKDVKVLDKLQEEMAEAAEAQAFERAAVLRDRLASLRWLRHKLDDVERARVEGSFIYPVAGSRPLWYVIHGGRTLAALHLPACRQTAEAVQEVLARVYQKGTAAEVLESYEHYDGMALVSLWFRRHPEERKKTLTPEQAVAHCRKLTRGAGQAPLRRAPTR